MEEWMNGRMDEWMNDFRREVEAVSKVLIL